MYGHSLRFARSLIAVALIGSASTLAIAAEPTTAPLKPRPPVVRPVVVPPPAPTAPPTLLACRSDARAHVVRPMRSARYCIATVAGLPALVQSDAPWPPEIPIDGNLALALRADRQFSDLWPDLDAVMGSGAEELRGVLQAESVRNYRNGRASTAPSDTLESVNSGGILAVLNHAQVLQQTGQVAEALALLDAALPQLEGRRRAGFNAEYDYLSLRLRAAQIQFNAGAFDAALAVLRSVEEHPRIRASLRVNAMVNHAAYLAELGEAAQSLALIDAALAIFNESGDLRLNGSDRQFGWIRSCALQQLGRGDEAMAALQSLRNAPENVPEYGAILPSSSSIAVRAAFCRNDLDWLAQLAADEHYVAAPFAVLLQADYVPANPRRQQVLQQLREHLAGTPVMERIEQLPTHYAAALNNWRAMPDESPAAAPTP